LTFTVIFGNIANLPTDGLPDFLFYLSGTVVWNYFADCLRKTSETFISNASIFGKVYFPRLVMPISTLISNMITFTIQFTFFLAFLAYFMVSGADVHVTAWALTLPLLIVLMAGLGMGIIISSLTTKYRDLRYLVTFGVSLWMYATPVIYPVSSIPERWQWIARINPITPIIETFRFAFLGAGSADWGMLAYSGGFTAVVFVIGLMILSNPRDNKIFDNLEVMLISMCLLRWQMYVFQLHLPRLFHQFYRRNLQFFMKNGNTITRESYRFLMTYHIKLHHSKS